VVVVVMVVVAMSASDPLSFNIYFLFLRWMFLRWWLWRQ